MAAAASTFRSVIMVALSITSGPDRSPIAFPTGQPSASELQVKPVAAVRQCRAFDIGKRGIEFVAGPPGNIVKRHVHCGRGWLGIHAEGKRGGVLKTNWGLLAVR